MAGTAVPKTPAVPKTLVGGSGTGSMMILPGLTGGVCGMISTTPYSTVS